MRILSLLPIILLAIAGCQDRTTPPPPATASASTASRPATAPSTDPVAAASAPDAAPDPYAPVMSDRELGQLIESCSEPTGDFPSDNFVSNETSYLHVAKTLIEPSMEGTAYVGVGPEQNLTYAVMTRPAMVYIVDIRRQNMLEHLVLRALAEDAGSRLVFLGRLTARDVSACTIPKPELATIDEIADGLAKIKASDEQLQREVERTLALMGRLGLERRPGDDDAIRKIHEAFAGKGLDLAYSMKGSGRRYPEIRKLLAAADDTGEQRSFVKDEATFEHLQGMYRANRIVPVVGDFSGDRALRGVAEDMKRRKLVLGVFYTSNVEQYLFEGGTYGKFIDNVKQFPRSEASVFLRVWFDQGRAHPAQRDGHRTTSLTAPVDGFLTRHEQKPFRTYWHVVTWDGSMGR